MVNCQFKDHEPKNILAKIIYQPSITTNKLIIVNPKRLQDQTLDNLIANLSNVTKSLITFLIFFLILLEGFSIIGTLKS